ncbi:MAG: hypothetical protein WCS85_05015, partial [Candidatus Peribacteraceae bacterium]
MRQRFPFRTGEARLIWDRVRNAPEGMRGEAEAKSRGETEILKRAEHLFRRAADVEQKLADHDKGPYAKNAQEFRREWEALREKYEAKMRPFNDPSRRTSTLTTHTDQEAVFQNFRWDIEKPLNELEELLQEWELVAKPSEHLHQKELRKKVEGDIQKFAKKKEGQRRFRTRYDKATKTTYWEEYDPDFRKNPGTRRDDMGSKTIAQAHRELGRIQAKKATGEDQLNAEIAEKGIGGSRAEAIRQEYRTSEAKKRLTGGARLNYSGYVKRAAPVPQGASEPRSPLEDARIAREEEEGAKFSALVDTVPQYQKPIEYTFTPEEIDGMQNKLVQIISSDSRYMLPKFAKVQQWIKEEPDYRRWNVSQARKMEELHRSVVKMANRDTLGIENSDRRRAALKEIVPGPEEFPAFVAQVLESGGIDPDSVPTAPTETGKKLSGGWVERRGVRFPPTFPPGAERAAAQSAPVRRGEEGSGAWRRRSGGEEAKASAEISPPATATPPMAAPTPAAEAAPKPPEVATGSKATEPSHSERGAPRGFSEQEMLNHLTSLSPEQVTAFAKKYPAVLSFNGLKTLHENTASALSSYTGTLELNGLTTLNEATAKALDPHARSLRLNGLKKLDQATAAQLSRYEGWSLQLNGLTTLDEATAKALNSRVRSIELNGLTSLGENTAAALAGFRMHLGLRGLKTLEEPIATRLAGHEGGILSLDGLITLTPDSARALQGHKGWLSIEGMKELDESTASELAKHEGPLSLCGLVSVPAVLAKKLAAWPGELTFANLSPASFKAIASTLAKHRGELHLTNISKNEIPSDTLAAWKVHWGKVILKDGELERSAAQIGKEEREELKNAIIADIWNRAKSACSGEVSNMEDNVRQLRSLYQLAAGGAKGELDGLGKEVRKKFLDDCKAQVKKGEWDGRERTLRVDEDGTIHMSGKPAGKQFEITFFSDGRVVAKVDEKEVGAEEVKPAEMTAKLAEKTAGGGSGGFVRPKGAGDAPAAKPVKDPEKKVVKADLDAKGMEARLKALRDSLVYAGTKNIEGGVLTVTVVDQKYSIVPKGEGKFLVSAPATLHDPEMPETSMTTEDVQKLFMPRGIPGPAAKPAEKAAAKPAEKPKGVDVQKMCGDSGFSQSKSLPSCIDKTLFGGKDKELWESTLGKTINSSSIGLRVSVQNGKVGDLFFINHENMVTGSGGDLLIKYKGKTVTPALLKQLSADAMNLFPVPEVSKPAEKPLDLTALCLETQFKPLPDQTGIMASVHVDRKIMPIMENKLGESYPELHVQLKNGVIREMGLWGNSNDKRLSATASVQKTLDQFKGKNITDVIKTMADTVKNALEKEYSTPLSALCEGTDFIPL